MIEEKIYVNIRVRNITRDKLQHLGKKAQTYDDIIWGLIIFWNEAPRVEGNEELEPFKDCRQK